MNIGNIFLEKYSIREEIGVGSFGRVYKLQDQTNKKSFALKIDQRQKGNTLHEAKILSELQGGEGIPKLYKYGSHNDYTYMIIELLDKTLHQHVRNQGNVLKISTVVSIMVQLIQRIAFVHSKGYLHRDIKPNQILTGLKNKKLLYIIDFGLARKYEANNCHVSYQDSCPKVGNSTFSSLNNHSGIRQSRRDDLESLAFLAIYLIKGRLP